MRCSPLDRYSFTHADSLHARQAYDAYKYRRRSDRDIVHDAIGWVLRVLAARLDKVAMHAYACARVNPIPR
jgi:3-methyladenine DNA glycosylase AlkD